MRRRDFLTTVGGALAWPYELRARAQHEWSAGVASIDITPETSLWMGGFAARKQASQGVALPLHAKALALRAGDRMGVLVAADVLGLTARITERVASAVRRSGVSRADVFFNASHTHCGPIVERQLSVAYDLSEAQWAAIGEYTAVLERKLQAVIEEAIARLAPATLSRARGDARFAKNRRVKFTPDGPVDHSVPVLRVNDRQGKLVAIVFGYACHNTTLPATFVQFHGDYAGVAQAALEERHRGATALFVAGCGADANPDPRGTLDLVNAHGTALADAVDRVLPAATQVPATLRTGYATVDLAFADGEARERWMRQLDIPPVYLQRHTELMEGLIRREGRLPAAQPMPIHTWRLGRNLVIVGLGGEVVVDYTHRIAREHPDGTMWVAGYTNDVFGYVPSARVLREGGYEGGDAMIYYGRPAPFTGAVEDTIVSRVNALIRGVSR
jgi:hypothetical protein